MSPEMGPSGQAGMAEKAGSLCDSA